VHGPASMAACNHSMDHCSPQLTGQPLVAYCNSSAAASCLSALFLGSMWPTNLIEGFWCVVVSEGVSFGLRLYLLSVVNRLVLEGGCFRSRLFLFDG